MIAAIIVGGIAGWIASKIMNTDAQMGVLANIIVGIIGSSIGGFIVQRLGLDPQGGFVWSVLVGVLGAVVLLWIFKLVTGRR